MRSEVIDFEQLTDSREMLEAKEPNFIVIFIYLLLIIFIAAFLWMWFGEIDITVKATGILRPGLKVSIIRNINCGEIKEITYNEGENVKKGDQLFKIDSTLYLLKQEQFFTEKDDLNEEIELLKLLEQSIKQSKNLFSKEQIEYYNRYLIYKYQYEQLKLDYNQAKNRYLREKKLSSSSTTKSRLEELKSAYQFSALKKEKYTSETMVNLKKELKNKRDKLSQVEAELKDTKNRINLNTVTAPITGTIQILQEFNKRDYMPAGIEVLRIIPKNGNDYKMEIMVQNKDISQLKLGQKIRYRFSALPYKEYGTLTGEILKISEDVVMDQVEAKLAYRVEASIKGTKLFDKNGKPAYIKPGMVCEARVVVRQKKIIHFVLEKLNFLS